MAKQRQSIESDEEFRAVGIEASDLGVVADVKRTPTVEVMPSLKWTGYNDILDAGQRRDVEDLAVDIYGLNEDIQNGIVEVGLRLIDAKEILEHGQFHEFVDAEWDYSPRTATDLMNIARQFQDDPEAAGTFNRSVLGMLAAPSTDNEILEAAKNLAQERPVTTADVKSLKATGKPAAPKFDGDEYGTPGWFIDLVRAVLGTIDFDPASNDAANEIVKAGRYATKEVDGVSLDFSWAGNGFMNMPYSSPTPWIHRAIAEYQSARMTGMIILVNNDSSVAWYQTIAKHAHKCDIYKRIPFLENGKESKGNRTGQTAFYLGDDFPAFDGVFSSIGMVYPRPGYVAPVEATGGASGAGDGSLGRSTCRLCSRPLEDPESIKAGIGPCCAAKEAAQFAREAAKVLPDAVPTALTPADHGTVIKPFPGQVAVYLSDDLIHWIIETQIERPITDPELAQEFYEAFERFMAGEMVSEPTYEPDPDTMADLPDWRSFDWPQAATDSYHNLSMVYEWDVYQIEHACVALRMAEGEDDEAIRGLLIKRYWELTPAF